MNKLLSTSLIALTMLVAACTGVEPSADFDAVLSESKPATLETPQSSSWVITPESTGTLDLTWRGADYGRSIPSSYTVIITHGEKSIEYPVPTGLKGLSIPLQELNKRLITEMELSGNEVSDISIIVESLPMASSGNAKVLEQYRLRSEPLKLSITPYFASLRPDLYYLVGDISGAEGAPVWDPSNTDYLLMTDDNNSHTYHYYGYFKEGAAFKIFPADCIGGWDKPVLGLKDGQLHRSGDASNITLPEGSTAGYYHLTFTVNRGSLNPSQCSYAFEPFEEQSMPTFSKLGIIGTAGLDWDHDLFLQQSKGEAHLWIGRGVALKEGEFKFRADAAWSANWGGESKEQFPSNFGVSEGGENWKVTAKEAGSYTIYFNDLTGHYFFDKLEE